MPISPIEVEGDPTTGGTPQPTLAESRAQCLAKVAPSGLKWVFSENPVRCALTRTNTPILTPTPIQVVSNDATVSQFTKWIQENQVLVIGAVIGLGWLIFRKR